MSTFSNILQDKDSSTMPKMFQDVRKRDDKVRTFAPSDNLIKLKEDEEKEIYKHLARLKFPSDIKPTKLSLDTIKRPKDLKRDKILKSTNQYGKINLDHIKGLISRINRNGTEGDNIVDLCNNEKNYFRDLNDFLYDIMDGKINGFNKEREYEKRLKKTEKNLANKTIYNEFTELYEQLITTLKNTLFADKKFIWQRSDY